MLSSSSQVLYQPIVCVVRCHLTACAAACQTCAPLRQPRRASTEVADIRGSNCSACLARPEFANFNRCTPHCLARWSSCQHGLSSWTLTALDSMGVAETSSQQHASACSSSLRLSIGLASAASSCTRHALRRQLCEARLQRIQLHVRPFYPLLLEKKATSRRQTLLLLCLVILLGAGV